VLPINEAVPTACKGAMSRATNVPCCSMTVSSIEVPKPSLRISTPKSLALAAAPYSLAQARVISKGRAETHELDVQVMELVKHFEEVTHRTCQAVAGPHHNDVELVLVRIRQQLVERGPAGASAAETVIGIFLGIVHPRCSANCRRSQPWFSGC
jgi:hypothetical protein